MITSKPLAKPIAIEDKYCRELQSLVQTMVKDFSVLLSIFAKKRSQIAMDSVNDKWLSKEIHERMKKLGAKWEKRFSEYAEQHTEAYVRKLLKMTDMQLKMILDNFFSPERLVSFSQVIPVPLRQSMAAHIFENVVLIKSIPEQFLTRIAFAVNKSISGAGSLQQLKDDIVKLEVVTKKRAALIAIDQTRKIYSNLTVRRFDQLGIKKMKWVHSGAGKHPRDLHMTKFNGDYSRYPRVNGLNGLIFPIDNPPVIQLARGNQPEVRGYAADLINCRCVNVAVID